MSENLVIRETVLDGIVRLRFNRPEKLNALSTPMVEELDHHLDQLALDPQVRGLVLVGTGGRAFIAGADIAEYQGGKHEKFTAYQLRSRSVFDKLETFPKPTIAAVQGYALGGGFEIALCCDILICAHSARMGLPEGRLGLSPGGGGTQRLLRSIGKHAASDVMLAGRYLYGERAYQLGLASVLCTDEAFDEAIELHSRALLSIAPLAQAQMKRLMRQGIDAAQSTAQSLEQEVLFRLYASEDGQEGIDAFLEKRTPLFKGR
ncbi:enoyl-CoA hydratase/isomerase family protein [Phyllobacterium myrsinacearum]|jgi:enoyl-CoA hydratase|uniref:3-hydroxybutyryl-CoA dehydratase n=1 Tax=Phyllobacterium myrsinacearum TaxID=28101 RepID=A0A2S9JQN3_9HYPH|nr:enoyl-CoA hydratase-related protein [Phyllobacterium myrsinacearum]PRD55540.1 3-hydroxybutyryl-CoA dehydratase [Phyllobacterium myrsinacearum]PWV91894.1 short chain enoyl-CoA hydratase [Phyllobacterium myrsinacearum]RZS77268.1 short chain enoyl-CoA hydratase [Phyllobacterium myrsinacearum]RZV05961.1 short chain enoyl-CoA hydratase [Phyllobacterium myrsinacearum]